MSQRTAPDTARNTARKKMTTRQISWIGIAIVAALLVAGFLFSGTDPSGGLASTLFGADDGTGSSDGGADVIRKMPVVVSPVEFVSTRQERRVYTGLIKSKQNSDIGFELMGRITEILVDEGDEVSHKQPLAVIGSESLVARRDSILADLDRAKQVMNELNAGPRAERIEAAKADLRAAEAQRKLADVDLARAKRLIRDGAIARSEFDRAQFERRNAVANEESATQRLAELLTGTREEQLSAQQASVRSLEAALAEVEVSITNSTVIAPFDALVTRRMVSVGSIVMPGVPVVSLVDHKNLEAWIGLPPEIAAMQIPDSICSLTVGGQDVRAQCIAKLGELDQQTWTQTVLFKILADEQTGEMPDIVTGQLCQIEVLSQVKANGFEVPNSALVSGARGLWAVFVAREIQDQWTVVRCEVEVVKTGVEKTLCAGTLLDGALLITEGVHKITAGQAVEITKQDPPVR